MILVQFSRQEADHLLQILMQVALPAVVSRPLIERLEQAICASVPPEPDEPATVNASEFDA